MKVTIVYAHPWNGSYNHVILERSVQALKKKHGVEVIDLNKDRFNPVLNEQDLSVYKDGKYFDEKVKAYQEILNKTDYLVLIYPTWWADIPAILKGFFDKVLLKNWAWTTTDRGFPKGLLTHIKGVTIITTMTGPSLYYNLIVGNPMKGSLVKGTMKFCGMKKVKVIKVGSIANINDEKRKKWLDKIDNYMEKI